MLRGSAAGESRRVLSIRDAALATLTLDVVPLAQHLTSFFFATGRLEQLKFGPPIDSLTPLVYTAVLLFIHFAVLLIAPRLEASADSSVGGRLLITYFSFGLLCTNAVSVWRFFSLAILKV